MPKDPKIKKPRAASKPADPKAAAAPRVKKAYSPPVQDNMEAWRAALPVGEGTESWRAWGLAKPTRVHSAMANLARKTPLKPSTGNSKAAQWRNYGLKKLENKSASGKIGSEASAAARANKKVEDGTTDQPV